MKRLWLLSLLALWPGLARADGVSLDEIVRRATAVLQKSTDGRTCRFEFDNQILDGKGAVQTDERRELEQRTQGEERHTRVLRAWKNGQELGTAELAKENAQLAKKKSRTEAMISPFSKDGARHYRFILLRDEPLWGHASHVVRVIPQGRDQGLVDGTAWIDASSYVLLKGVYTFAKLPSRSLSWLKLQAQFALDPKGIAIPTLLEVDGGGSLLFKKFGFRTTTKALSCN